MFLLPGTPAFLGECGIVAESLTGEQQIVVAREFAYIRLATRDSYDHLISIGIPPDIAQVVLPPLVTNPEGVSL